MEKKQNKEEVDMLSNAKKILNDAPVPTKDRMVYDPETDTVITQDKETKSEEKRLVMQNGPTIVFKRHVQGRYSFVLYRLLYCIF